MHFAVHKRPAIGRVVVVVLVIVVLVIAAGGLYYYFFGTSAPKAQTTTVSLIGLHIQAAVANGGSGETTIDCSNSANRSASYIELRNNGTASATITTIYLVYGNISTSNAQFHQYNAPGLACAASVGSSIYMNIYDLKIPPTTAKAGDSFTGILSLKNGWSLHFSGTFS